MLTGTYVDDRLHGIAHILSGSDGSFLEVIRIHLTFNIYFEEIRVEKVICCFKSLSIKN